MMWLQKSSKAPADMDLPPHLANQPVMSSQATPSKPNASHQSSMSRSNSSSKPTVVPIPASDQNRPSSSSRKRHEQPAGKAHARLEEEDFLAAGRNSTPSRKPKQPRSQDGKLSNSRPEAAATPAVVRKVVPIKLERTPRHADTQPGPARGSGAASQSNDQAHQPASSTEAQVNYPITQRRVLNLLLHSLMHVL